MLFAKVVGQAENSGKVTGNENTGSTTAKGLYQFTDDSMTTAIHRLERTTGMQPWMRGALSHRDANQLTKGQQDELFFANLWDRAKTDSYMRKIMETGDVVAMKHLYMKEHHTKPDPKVEANWDRAVRQTIGDV